MKILAALLLCFLASCTADNRNDMAKDLDDDHSHIMTDDVTGKKYSVTHHDRSLYYIDPIKTK